MLCNFETNPTHGLGGGGVPFLDTIDGRFLGVAYLITKNQFDHVTFEENSDRPQNPRYGEYEDTIDLESRDGFEVKIITNKSLCLYNEHVPKDWILYVNE